MSYIILEMPKRMDSNSLAKTRKMIQDGFAQDPAVVVLDFAKCGFVDSRGLSVIVTGLKLASEKKCSLRLVHVSEEVRLLLQITRFDRICDIHETMESATRA